MDSPSRSSSWKWAVCGMLLLATMLNYMDRLTLNQTARRIKESFCLSNEAYGLLESAFGVAFALGALAGGWMVDRWNVRVVYPVAVLAWSLAGSLTGYAHDYFTLMACRFCLGFAEASHWPCALRTTQRILKPQERTLGNSILQSGAAIGAVLTPLMVLTLLEWTDSWRFAFVAIGGLGIFWVILWLFLVAPEDLALPAVHPSAAGRDKEQESVRDIFFQRSFWVLVAIVLSINAAWHFFRVWMPLFLQESHHYTERETNYFTSAYYLSTDVGSLAAGFGTLWLAGRGMSVHKSRLCVFFFCALLTTLSVLASRLDRGPLLLMVLLVIGFGALGLFPNYYSFSQELTVRHQGKVTGALGFIAWMSMAPVHWLVGKHVDQTKSYAEAMALVGLAPLLAFFALVFFWGKNKEK